MTGHACSRQCDNSFAMLDVRFGVERRPSSEPGKPSTRACCRSTTRRTGGGVVDVMGKVVVSDGSAKVVIIRL